MLRTTKSPLHLPVALLLLGALAGAAAADAPPLVTSSVPVSVGVRVQPSVYEAQLDVRQAGTITLLCPLRPGLVSITGLKQRTEVRYDSRARLLTLTLPPGRYALTVRPLP